MNTIVKYQFHKNNLQTIYDAHAANMYGCIYKLVQNKQQAEEILINIFRDFASNNPPYYKSDTSTIWFIKHALKSAYLYLKEINCSESVFTYLKDLRSLPVNKYQM